MAVFLKISLWIITMLLLMIAIPFFPSIPSVLLLFAAINVVPIKKVKQLRARIFNRKRKQTPDTGNKPTVSPGQDLVNIGPWNIPTDEYLKTAARYERGLQIDQGRIGRIDRKRCTVEILGSEGYPYKVSLAGCECIDYQTRGLPCKHMLRLAKELGEEISLPVFDPFTDAEYDVNEDIARLTERWKAGQITTEAYTKCVKALQSSADFAADIQRNEAI